jgi:hypothetical protein
MNSKKDRADRHKMAKIKNPNIKYPELEMPRTRWVTIASKLYTSLVLVIISLNAVAISQGTDEQISPRQGENTELNGSTSDTQATNKTPNAVPQKSSVKNDSTKAEKKEEDPFKDMPKSGIIASSNSGIDSFGVNSLSASKALEGKDLPITGSVGSDGEFKKIVKVTNGTDKSVKVNARLIQTDSKGVRKLRSDYMSLSLGPKASIERKVGTATGSAGYVLEIVSWKVKK